MNRLQLKAWNREGNATTELSRFLVEDRLPKLVKIMNFFGRKDGLDQLVKYGHTHIFYDLDNYHRELSKSFNMKWVRIRRKRINVARSFAQDRGGRRPDPCLSEKGVVVCPFDKMSLLKPSRIAWDAWTVFMQHLWFVDEIEARWRVLVQNQGDDTKMDIFTLKFQEYSDSISPNDVDDLAAFMNVASPREVMGRMPHLSHIAGPKMSQSEMEAEALRYMQKRRHGVKMIWSPPSDLSWIAVLLRIRHDIVVAPRRSIVSKQSVCFMPYLLWSLSPSS